MHKWLVQKRFHFFLFLIFLAGGQTSFARQALTPECRSYSRQNDISALDCVRSLHGLRSAQNLHGISIREVILTLGAAYLIDRLREAATESPRYGALLAERQMRANIFILDSLDKAQSFIRRLPSGVKLAFFGLSGGVLLGILLPSTNEHQATLSAYYATEEGLENFLSQERSQQIAFLEIQQPQELIELLHHLAELAHMEISQS
jgi:hypothetical protein